MAHLHIGEAAPDYPFGCGSDRMLSDWDITPERRIARMTSWIPRTLGDELEINREQGIARISQRSGDHTGGIRHVLHHE
jgi:hypothetical protein